MINYRSNKKKYKVNELGSLYVDESKVSSNEQPIIYIGGQMEHRMHLLERSGFTGDLNHNMYTGSWMYEYPVTSRDKQSINGKNFSESLLATLREAKLREVILVTHSYGGTIGAYATKSELIDKVISIHPPILGTPLARPEYIDYYKEVLTKSQKLIAAFLKVLINFDYGFEKDNFDGVDLSDVDLNKLLVVGNNLDENSERNKLLLETYNIIKTISCYLSDGVVVFDSHQFERRGIPYLESSQTTNHFDSSNKDYVQNIVKRVLEK